MFRLLLSCTLWSLGVNNPPSANASGFGEEQLAPARPRNGLERTISVLSTVLFLTGILQTFLELESLAFVHAPGSIVCVIPACLWGLQTIARPSLPMDRTAIAVGLWTFAPYFPLFLLGAFTLIPLVPLLWQMGGVLLLFAYGLVRDVRRQMS